MCLLLAFNGLAESIIRKSLIRFDNLTPQHQPVNTPSPRLFTVVYTATGCLSRGANDTSADHISLGLSKYLIESTW